MKELIEKAHLAMNLILLGSVLLAWACLSSADDPVQIGVKLYRWLQNHSNSQNDVGAQRFFEEVTGASEKRLSEKVAHVRISYALGVSSFARGFSSPSTQLLNPDEKRAVRGILGRDDDPFSPTNSDANRVYSRLMYRISPDSPDGLIHRLEGLIQQAGITNVANMSLGELRERFDSKVKVPFIDKEIAVRTAIAAIGSGLLAPFMYLVCLLSGIRFVLTPARKDFAAGLHWLYFLPNKLAPWLASAWLASSTIILAASCFMMTTDTWLRLGLGVALGSLSCKVILDSLKLRHLFLKALSKTGENTGADCSSDI